VPLAFLFLCLYSVVADGQATLEADASLTEQIRDATRELEIPVRTLVSSLGTIQSVGEERCA
jgi:hypothetical protein